MECENEGCSAARLGSRLCVSHATLEEIGEAVKIWLRGGALDARRARIDGDCLTRLIKALEDVEVPHAKDPPTRVRASPVGRLRFNWAVFESDADFGELQIHGEALFDHATFEQAADFSHTTFHAHADFDHAEFSGAANFRDAKFCDYAGFAETRFEGEAKFPAAIFRDYVDLEGARFAEDLEIEGAKFETARQVGPLTVAGRLRLESSEFRGRVTIEATTPELLAQGTVFVNGARLLLAGGTVDLERADLGRASALAGASPAQPPQLLGLTGAQVAGLTLSGLDLKRCRFYGAHGLESMNIEPNCIWARPEGSHWCMDREMISEENEWRTQDERRRGTHLEPGEHPAGPESAIDQLAEESAIDQLAERTLQPMQLAALYRALRKAREDSNDQAGAGDLYYGEMEMRRHAPMSCGPGKLRIAAEKSLIFAYWLTAGYGLRASRSLMVLAATVLIASIALTIWGFHPARSYLGSILFSAQSSLTLIHPPEAGLTRIGKVLELAIRVTGPALVALTILSLRSRIKR